MFFVIFGIILLILILLAIRHEFKFLSTNKTTLLVKVLSFISFLFMLCLSLTIIFHFFFNLVSLVFVVITLAVILLILTPVQVAFRMRSFNSLKEQRILEKTKLLREVSAIIDDGKREENIGTDTDPVDVKPDEGESEQSPD